MVIPSAGRKSGAHIFSDGKSGTPTFLITVNAAGSGITSLIEQKSPWRSMAASVMGSTVGYGVGKAEKPLDKFFNPPKNDMKWMQSPNTPIFYPYPKSNLPAIIAGSGSAVLSEVATHATEDSMRLYEVLK